MQKKHSHHTENSHHHKPKRKKISPFYKISFSLLLIAFIALFYFVVLVATGPKSIPFITQAIREKLEKNFGHDNVGVSDSYLSFTRYGTMKIMVSSLNILYSEEGGAEKKSFMIPRLEAEFSLFNFLLLRFQPVKIKITNANIVIKDLQNFKLASGEEILNQQSQISLIVGLLSSIRKGDNPIENFEIENAKLLIRSEKFNGEILLKRSQIHASTKNKTLNISSQNQISFDEKKSDVNLDSSCKLSKHDGLKCDLFLENFVPDSISALHQSLSHLSKVSASFNAVISFAVKDGELSNISFKARSEKGDFEFLDFFGHKMDFSNFSVTGEYDHKMKILDLSKIETDFESSLVDKQLVSKPHLEMSLMISSLSSPQQKMNFYIRLQNVLTNELEKFWPTALHENGVRDWVISHIENGVIKNASAKFSLLHDSAKTQLEDIDSEVVFSGLKLAYDPDFPTISDLSGIANFTKKNMKISIGSGVVLNSKISEALVEIDDFDAPITMLEISGKSQGHAADGLKHANNDSEFFAEVEKYLNGNSQNEFDIRLPLQSQIMLKNSYIAVKSTVTGLSSDYIRGALFINAKKDFNSTNFVANVDLTAAEIIAKPFDVTKKANVESDLNFVVVLKDPKKIRIKNIVLWKKKEVLDDKNSAADSRLEISRINGDVEFETAPFLLTTANFKNENFGKNNYAFSYQTNKKTSTQKIILRGEKINLGSFIEQKFLTTRGEEKFSNTQIQVAANRIDLLKNKFLKNFYFSANCTSGLCYQGLAKTNYGNKKILNLRIAKSPKENFSTIEGVINDIGYLAEGFGISNVVSDGDAKVELKNRSENKTAILQGEITINNSITIYETPTVKRFSKDNLFSQIKDKIFSSEKTIFDSVKLNFDLSDGILNIRSLIANNYKIGITAKGSIDLKNNSYTLKGMIIPGFLINNLFGIGNIPIIGGVISGILTGGEGGGVFGLRYEYTKTPTQKEGIFSTNKVAAFVPSTLQNLFD